MTLTESIEVLTDFRHQESELLGNEFSDALQIGIEAMKREKVWRLNDPGGAIYLLPGETEG